MSLASKAVLYGSCILSAGIVAYVHIQQQVDREKLHEGVVRDIKRQELKHAENLSVQQLQHQTYTTQPQEIGKNVA